MRSVFLCGHTGSRNRGCEAIVRSTVKLLGERSGDVFLATFAQEQDWQMAGQTGIHLIPYNRYASRVQRYLFGILRKLSGNPVYGQGKIQKSLFEKIRQGDLCLNIGGDTYCYGRPVVSLALNRYTYKKGIRNILWCCSIEKDVIKGEILEDLLRYQYIFARETITYHSLLEAGVPEEKVIKCCDPAFFLDMQEVPLPDGFLPGETVGVNVSGLTVNPKNPYAYENVIHTIRYILDNTQMSVCLIPHVYSIGKNREDYPLLKRIKQEFNSDRISIVDQEYNCQQLKYIISHCRFFIGSRTHATIAAYSTCVPTLVMGYSVKSRGIAVDLFGTDEGYVLPYTQCTEKMELTSAFCALMAKETAVRERLEAVLPDYRQQLLDGIDRYIKESETKEQFEICHSQVCTGCGACAQRCPAACIEMVPDEEGFLYPHIDYDKCLRCGLCQKMCPVATGNRSRGDKVESYSAMHKDEDIRKNSSSGGFFTAVAEQILDMGGVVFGAGFDQNFTVVHKMVQNRQELVELRGSKYVQSFVGNTYVQAKTFLDEGRPVLFVGSPCQIGGLKAFLGKEYDNLYTIDFICHGVPSPRVWKSYLNEKEAEANSKAVAVSFREKTYGWRNFSLAIRFENGQEYAQTVSVDPYLRGFVANLFLRPSCGNCSFKADRYQSDLTMADHWGVEKDDPRPAIEKGVSLILVRSSKGRQLMQWTEQKVDSSPVEYAQAVRSNISVLKSVKHNDFRKSFFRRLREKNVTALVARYCGHGFIAKIRRMLAKLFEVTVR